MPEAERSAEGLPGKRVALAISAFRSDAAVIALLEQAFAPGGFAFHAVIVVDSLGSGRIAAAIAEHGWPVIHEDAACNLGSAGNLARRIALADAEGADWCWCLNHDAALDPAAVAAMLVAALKAPRTGAVYPVLHHGGRPNPWEDGRRSFVPSASRRLATRPEGDAGAQVLWSSSNGALYGLGPYRAGLRVRADLWMGYEDLAYGMTLHGAGWSQRMCRDAVMAGIFDYKAVRFAGRVLLIPDKPPWYCYYNLRNLVLIRRGAPVSLRFWLTVLRKGVRETAKILMLEDRKGTRLRLLWRGALHGIAGRTGKGAVP
jgi:hypothetical protein